jgi:CDGSH-type Zn-finger protein
MATIKVIQNGPYLVQGDDVTAVDWNGASYAIAKRPFALCRCRTGAFPWDSFK